MNESQIFTNALRLATPAERAAYLDAACAGDTQLRAAVEGLLRARASDPDFLERPAASLTGTVDAPPAAERPTATADPAPERPGVVLAGRYKLLEEIGEGGMGTVWMAQQTEPVKRTVAVKLIRPGMDSKAVLARFEAERQALALMDHPHIAKVHDAGATPDGRPYFVMELVKGVPITKYCDDHRLTPKDRLALFVQVCQAVQHAHQKGIIHRDLKPSNVLVAPYDGKPVVKVIDFGVAKAAGQPLTEKTLVTGFGAVVGTPEYMSPEQAELNNQDIDTRSDIYSLGVLLYELLTGTTPLTHKRVKDAALFEVLRVVREEEPPRPSTRLSTTDELPSIAANRGLEPKKLSGLVRGELDWIVMKTLEKDRSRRYETANGLAMDLQRHLADEPVLACPPSATYRLRKFVHRNKAPVMVVALVFLTLVAGVIGTTWGLFRAEQARQGEEQQRHAAEANARLADRRTREATWNLYTARLFPMAAAWQERDFGHLEELLEQTTPDGQAPDFRGWEWYYFRDQVRQASTPLRGEVAYTEQGDWCRRTGHIAATRADGAIDVWDESGRKRLRTLPAQGNPSYRLGWSPDGRHLASGHEDGMIRVWDVDAGKVLRTLPGHPRYGRRDFICLAWSPDGTRLASAGGEGLIKLWDVGNGQLLGTLTAREGLAWYPSALAWHPDGVRLAAGYRWSRVTVWNTKTNAVEFTKTFPDGGRPTSAIDWSPDGTRLAAGIQTLTQSTIVIWDDRGKELQSLVGHGDRVNCLRWSADGMRLASCGLDQTVRVWDPGKVNPLLTLRLHRRSVSFVAWSPSGDRVLSGGDGLRLAGTDRLVPQAASLPVGTGREADMAWSPDGRQLAVVGHGGVAEIRDAVTGTRVHTLDKGAQLGPVFVSWHPNGERLALGTYGGIPVVCNARTGRSERRLLERGRGTYQPVAWSPDGRWLAMVIQDGETVVWDTATWDVVGRVDDHTPCNLLAWSPDSALLLAASNRGELLVWNVSGRKVVLSLSEPGGRLTDVAWSPDGRLLAAATQMGEVIFKDARDGRVVHILRHHSGAVNQVKWSPDGRQIATSGNDGTVRVYDAATAAALLTLPCGNTFALAVAWSPDSRRLACICSDGTLRVWGSPDIEAAPPVAALETGVLARVGRDASEQPAPKSK